MLADPVPRHAPALPVPKAPNARHNPADLLDFIRRFMGDPGYAPSVREIARACGMSTLSVAIYQLRILERAGRIERDRYVGRGIRLVAGEDSECARIRAQLADLQDRHARLELEADALRKRLARRGGLEPILVHIILALADATIDDTVAMPFAFLGESIPEEFGPVAARLHAAITAAVAALDGGAGEDAGG